MQRLLLSFILFPSLVGAQTLYADPYTDSMVMPETASFTINGGAPIPCELRSVPTGKQPACPLASIRTPGTYTLVMTVSKPVSCPTPDTCSGGSASSAPFEYRWLGFPVPPGLHLKP